MDVDFGAANRTRSDSRDGLAERAQFCRSTTVAAYILHPSSSPFISVLDTGFPFLIHNLLLSSFGDLQLIDPLHHVGHRPPPRSSWHRCNERVLHPESFFRECRGRPASDQTNRCMGHDAHRCYRHPVLYDDGFRKLGRLRDCVLSLTGEQINYTYGDLVATLTMVETPTATAFKTTVEDESVEVDAPLLSPAQKSEKQHFQELETELFLVKQAPITAKLRTAVKYLRSVGGPFARFRGFHIALIYHLIHGAIVSYFSSNIIAWRAVISIITTVALCRIQMVWTHVVISNPTTKAWYRRFPSVKAAKNIVLPTAVFAIAQQAAMFVPARLYMSVQDQLRFPEAYGASPEAVKKVALVEMICVFLIACSTIICLVIPAEVTLKRVQASMLPEEDETIVPFDRTFGGKVTPEILGGSGCIGMLDAWKTFGKEARWRLIKLYVKVFAIQGATTVLFIMTIIGELRLLMGDDFQKALQAAKDQFKH